MRDIGGLSEFRTLVHRAEALWNEVWPLLSSPLAIRIYVLTFIALTILATAWFAYRAKKKLTKIQNAALKMEFPGPDPVREDSIEKRQKVLEENAERELRPFRHALWHLLLFGFLVPTAVFVLGTVNYAWFDPIGLPFFDHMDGQPIQSTDALAIGWFILNQFSHGALFDAFEVFDINLAEVSNNPHNYWFSGAVLLYRSIMSAFVVALVIAVAQFTYVTRTFREKIAEEIERFRQAKPPPTGK